MTQPGEHDLVLVVDFGAQYAQLIARRVREARVYSEIVPHTMPVAEMLARKPKAIILSGGPSSVYSEGAPGIDDHVFTAGVPVFGMCYGFQLMAKGLGGEVAHTGAREYGRTPVSVSEPGTLLEGLPSQHKVWMSHGDSVARAPEGFTVLASTEDTPVAAFEDVDRGLAGVQWHPEVLHSEHGQKVLEHFLHHIAGARQTWTMLNIAEEQIERVREQIGDSGLAICGLSGGVDSAVAAAIVQRAIGDRLHCVFVDHGLLREGEAEQVERDFVAATGVNLHVFDARETFLAALAGVTDPEEKRKIIGREFIRAFEAAEVQVLGEAAEHGDKVGFLVQGTLYPDVVESGGGAGTSNIKSHHNVGGLPEDLEFALVEPLRTLFKDEVRLVGEQLGLPAEMVWRQPFPGPGLGIRIIGEVTADRLDILRRADAIARQELTRAGLDRDIWQMPVVLLADVRSVGVQGDGRTYGHPVVIRPVTSEDAMTADWARLPYDVMERISTRITNEVAEVNRVTLDITSKPPGTIEWE
ncbi:glutamine-hydrolyzing GMP synthase [Nocardioides sp. P5_E3]